MNRNHLPALVVSVVLAGLFSCGPGGQDASPPLSIGPWQQARFLDSQQAKAVVDAMHPLPIAPLRSWVGYYGGGIGITIFASKFNGTAQAQSALEAMNSAIGQGKSGFSEPQADTVAGQPGFHTRGMNKEHFFYVREAWLIWIEGKPGDFDPTVKSIRWGRAAREK